jgi:penicillin-binding protein 2
MNAMGRRLLVFRAIMALLFALILLRLVQLQLLEGRRNRQFAEENRIRVRPRTAPRGPIYDRRGRALATSRLSFTVRAVPEELRVIGSSDAVGALAKLLGRPRGEIAGKLSQAEERRAEVPLLTHCSPEIVSRLEEHAPYLSGVTVIADAARYYPHGALAAHALGYVREVSAEDLARMEGADLRPGELIGKEGVEKVAEACLRGVDGGDQIEVDATGRVVRTLGTVPPQEGRAVTLTLDLDLQRAAEEALGEQTGAVVALDPRTGAVLALVSHPAFDPNVFTLPLSRAEWRRLSGPDRPQQNRATSGLYAPGSVFKIVTAAAALEAGECDEGSSFYCSGSFTLGKWRLRCWKRGGHGALNYRQGFGQSCNVMFATLGRRVGVEGLAAMAHRFGLGEQTGIDVSDESRGLIPTEDWKRARRHEPWYPGDTCQMAIGQGDLLVTPLQVAQEVAVVANGGWLVQPHVLLRVEGEAAPRRWGKRRVELRAETLAALRDGMEAVVAEGGTAHRIASPDYTIAGKTGTAQAPRGDDHAWFAGYAPAEDPKIVVAVLVEHGGHGGATAAPIARRVFDAARLGTDP